MIILSDPASEPVVIGGGGWNIGETRQLQSNLERYEFGGMTLLKRSVAQTALASEFPVFYSLATPGTPQAYMTGRTVSPLGVVVAAGVNDVTVIAVTAAGEIARSKDAGVLFTKLTSPVTVRLGAPFWANDRWVIPYGGGFLLSTDDGITWQSFADANVGAGLGVSTRSGHLMQYGNKILHLPVGATAWWSCQLALARCLTHFAFASMAEAWCSSLNILAGCTIHQMTTSALCRALRITQPTHVGRLSLWQGTSYVAVALVPMGHMRREPAYIVQVVKYPLTLKRRKLARVAAVQQYIAMIIRCMQTVVNSGKILDMLS